VSRPAQAKGPRYRVTGIIVVGIGDSVRIRFLTATPLDVRRGSGTYVGISVLGRALESLGHRVEYETPRTHGVPRLPVYTAERLLFNRRLRVSTKHDLTVGFDMDGYRIAGAPGHVAALKGVIADEARFERGLTRWTMSAQARRERLHLERAASVIATSRYSAERAAEFYGLKQAPALVPEMIDLGEWRTALGLAGETACPACPTCFTVLFVGRFYRRKRVDVLLRAAARLRGRIPELAVRIVGNGPCAADWRRLARELGLAGTVEWLGDVSRAELAREYRRASLFCLPSVQEGFGIVLLEAMAAGKAIVAARAGAIPEVAPQASLVTPDDAEALAAEIERLYRSAGLREAQARAGMERVERFDAALVARAFLETAAGERVTGV
jgi:glycosyltransferase involved in cell wall biosynthesis